MSEKTLERPTLKPEFQPIADRYGRDLFDTALRIAILNVACDQLLARTRTSKQLGAIVGVVIAHLGDLSNDLIEAKGWHLRDVMECAVEIGKAKPVEESRIVLPN